MWRRRGWRGSTRRRDDTVTKDEIIAMAKEAGFARHEGGLVCILDGLPDPEVRALERFAALAAAKECDRICNAIKTEDDYCVDNGDYMLDSDDCIAVAQGEWNRPDFNLEVPA